ncbi:MAG: cytochrome c biogenesis protein CcsA [Planctomycetota bacterium]|jgi:ABC-type transport system involved in cytochrome c biogenesis permease subunit
MAIKYTLQGLLIYLTIASYALAFTATVARRRKLGQWLFAAGFGIALLGYIYRWIDVRHVPLQNLFEVFLSLGVLCYPISLLSRRVLRIGGQWADMLIGAIVLFPAGFVFHAEPQQLPPALQSWLFAPHVAVYMLSYVFMAKAAFQAGTQLSGARESDKTLLGPEEATYELIAIGFPLLTLGLILGSVWGKLAWGDYWAWDPKELWSLVSWLVYVGYFHWRYMFGKRYQKTNSAWALMGMAAIVITLLWVNLSKLFPGLHSYAT